ncbi:18282_t:CDS:10, partial [Rhizophagus irregularis]
KSSIIFEENQPLSAEIPRVFNIDCYDDNTMVVRIVPNPLRFYPVKKNFLLITYAEADDITNPFTYNDWGIVIDLDGVIHSKIKLGPLYVNNTTKEWKPGQDSITLNVHRDNGFIRTAPITNSTGFSLQQFKIDENGGIQQIVETVNIFPTGHPLETVATMDGGYALIYPNNTGLTGSNPISTTPLTPQFGIYFLLLGYEKGITQGPFVLYQTLTPINVLLLDCDFTYVGVGQTCIIIANSTQSDKTFIKIDFLSSGTVYNITTFQNINVTDYSIQSLRYGADVLVLPNNTLVIPQPEEGNSWSLLTTDLYKIEGERDHGYSILHINTTIPKIGDVIDPSETKFLIIKYYNKIVLSPNRNITILQDDGTSHGIIRQITSMTSTGNNGYDKFVELIDDEFSSIINITIINSTFNKPGGRYYVLIDDGFASSKDYHEPMIGIQSSAWNFTTLQEDDHANSIKEKYRKKVNSTRIEGKVRLTLDGTNYFKSIKHDKIKRKEFFNNLTQELVKAIPVSSERVTSNGRHEIDTSVSPEQYILSINIEKAKNEDENSVNSVADDLDTLIKNKFITLIGSGEYSNYLDHEYGYVTIPRWIEDNWKNLIITVLFNIKGNFAIYDCGNAIEEFATTILFTSIDAGSVENIFTTSIFFVTFPFIVNLGFAFIIIIDELTKTDLKKSLTKVNELLNNETDHKKSEKASNHPEIVSDHDHTEDTNDHTKDMEIEVAGDPDHTKDKKIKDGGSNPKEESTCNKLIKVVKELKKSIEELEDVIKLTKELKEVNELIDQLVKYIAESAEDEVKDTSEDKVKNNTEVDVKNIIEKLKVINELIKEIMQFENFVHELKELEKLPKEILTSTLRKVDEFIEDPEKSKTFKEEYTRILKVKLKKVNELNVDEFTKDPKKDKAHIKLKAKLKKVYTNLKAELDKVKELNELAEELKKINGLMKELKEVKELSEELEKVKMEKEENDRQSTQKKGYKKFSKWLKDYRDNQITTVLFITLAGVDITHLEFLGSKIQIRIPTERKIIWGKFFNALIGDISLIFLQFFYVTRVVSLGYTPVF